MAKDSRAARLLLSWNWKTGLLSGCIRASLFASFAIRAGEAAAVRAALLEIALITVLAGFQGALTQAFRRNPSWRTAFVCAGITASISHPAEWLVHAWAGTPNATSGVLLSFLYTVVATRFSLLAMHRGAFIAGTDARSIWDDLRQVPVLILAFAGIAPPNDRTRPHPNVQNVS
jgi:hypothetical protein